MTVLRSPAEVAATIPLRSARTIVGIAGAPGSGKSTLAAEVVQVLGPGAALLGMDGFHLSQSTLVELGRRDRMGAPDTFDVEAFVATLERLRRDEGTVTAPGFDREREEAVAGAIEIPPSVRTIVVEGNYLLQDELGWQRVAPLLDVTFFLQPDDGIRLQRLIDRHVRFGKSQDAAVAWAEGPDETNARLIRPGSRRADYLIELA
jgi:pantothenate kinase